MNLPGNQFSLAQIQNWMQTFLIAQGDEKQAENPENYINASTRLSAARHLSIYRRSYVARLREFG